MFKKLTLLVALSMLLIALAGCGEAEPKTALQVDLKGTFILTPNEKYDLSEELDDGKAYVLAVLDLTNPGDSNEMVSHLSSTLKFSANEYKAITAPRDVLKCFFANDGYYDLSYSGEMLGGDTNPKRICIAFQINPNDVANCCPAALNFTLGELGTKTFALETDDFQNITLFDNVFSVEENPDEYQLLRSMKARTEWVQRFFIMFKSYITDNRASLTVDTVISMRTLAEYMLKSDLPIGLTITSSASGGSITTDELPKFSMAVIKKYYPELEEKINYLNGYLTKTDNSGDLSAYDLINMLNKAIDLADEIMEYFD